MRPFQLRDENQRMRDFLAQHGIRGVKVKYIWTGSLKRTWRLYNSSIRWSQEWADKLNALGFSDFDGDPLDQHSGNGGLFSVFVRGHNEFVEGVTPSLASEASELIRVAKSLVANLQGMKKPQAVKFVNGLLSRHTKGFFSDQDWGEIRRRVWDVLDAEGIEYVVTKSEYINKDNQTGMPTGKQWRFEISFQNDKGKPTVLYGTVTASGAGSVDDPLSRYDIVAYVG